MNLLYVGITEAFQSFFDVWKRIYGDSFHCSLFPKPHRKQVVHVNAEKNPYQDLVYNPSYELSSSPYEPLRPPRKRDALRQQQQQQKRISTLEPYTQMSFGVDVDTSLTTTTTSTTKHIYAHTLNSWGAECMQEEAVPHWFIYTISKYCFKDNV